MKTDKIILQAGFKNSSPDTKTIYLITSYIFRKVRELGLNITTVWNQSLTSEIIIETSIIRYQHFIAASVKGRQYSFSCSLPVSTISVTWWNHTFQNCLHTYLHRPAQKLVNCQEYLKETTTVCAGLWL